MIHREYKHASHRVRQTYQQAEKRLECDMGGPILPLNHLSDQVDTPTTSINIPSICINFQKRVISDNIRLQSLFFHSSQYIFRSSPVTLNIYTQRKGQRLSISSFFKRVPLLSINQFITLLAYALITLEKVVTLGST